MLLDPRQIDAVYEIREGDDSLRRNRIAINIRHVALSLGFNVGRRALASCGNRTELLSSSAPLNSAADCAPFPIAQIPAVTDAEDLPELLATPH